MTALDRHRREKDRWLKRSPDSPIANREAFEGLDYYEHAPDLAFVVVPDPGDGREVTIDTSDGRHRTYTRDLLVTVEIEEERATFAVYGTPHGLFLPFRDGTSGTETYGGGRYLDLGRLDRRGRLAIDFNLAYNPFCAYDDRYSCPLPPEENRVSVPIRAGERAFRRA